jgi:hypothetical protein
VSGTQVAAERAARFVADHGDALARARALGIRGDTPADAVLALLAEPAPSDLAALACALAVCDEQRALRTPFAERVCAALEIHQRPDGGFGDPGLPSEARLQTTGEIGAALARAPFARQATLDAAGSFLAERFSPDLVQDFQYANLTAYAGFFASALHEAADAILQWCGRELERGFRARRFGALDTLRVLLRCNAHALPGARLDLAEVLLSLLAEQASDGSFGAAADPAARVEATLAGLCALGFAAGAGRGLDSAGAPR